MGNYIGNTPYNHFNLQEFQDNPMEFIANQCLLTDHTVISILEQESNITKQTDKLKNSFDISVLEISIKIEGLLNSQSTESSKSCISDMKSKDSRKKSSITTQLLRSVGNRNCEWVFTNELLRYKFASMRINDGKLKSQKAIKCCLSKLLQTHPCYIDLTDADWLPSFIRFWLISRSFYAFQDERLSCYF